MANLNACKIILDKQPFVKSTETVSKVSKEIEKHFNRWILSTHLILLCCLNTGHVCLGRSR